MIQPEDGTFVSSTLLTDDHVLLLPQPHATPDYKLVAAVPESGPFLIQTDRSELGSQF